MSGPGTTKTKTKQLKGPLVNSSGSSISLEDLSVNGSIDRQSLAGDASQHPLGGSSIGNASAAEQCHEADTSQRSVESGSSQSSASLRQSKADKQACMTATLSSRNHISLFAESDLISGQNDKLTHQLLAGALKLKSSLFRPEHTSFKEIAQNPKLAKKAQAEMDNHQLRSLMEGKDGSLAEGRPHDLEVARLQLSLNVIEADADEESKINAQLAHLICLRLDSARKAAERLLGILQAITAAEAAYSRSMTAVSRVKLWSDLDGPSIRPVLKRLSDIPWLLGEKHAGIQGRVVHITKSCQDIVAGLRQDCTAISHDSNKAHNEVLHARKALHTAFLTHRSTCRIADDVSMEKARGASAAKIELDPWLTESRVVSAHKALHATQTKERSILKAAYEKVHHHEETRCDALRKVIETCLNTYRGSLGTDLKEESSLRETVDKLDCHHDLRQFSASATTALSTVKELAGRQEAALEAASQDLLCSPDIIRQGQMARWVSGTGKWADCHFILTRSGFLHWLADAETVVPLGGLNLPKCHFEAGDAPKFNINEDQGGLFGKSKRMAFEAPSVEECCEWAIAVRESIAAHKGR